MKERGISKMKKRLFALILTAVLAAVSLTACSNDSGNTPKNNDNNDTAVSAVESQKDSDNAIAGTYTMTSYIKDGEPVDLSDNNSKGIFSTLDIKEDGTGEFDLFGIKSDVTVEGENITLAGSKSTYSLSGEVLTVVNGATTMVFKRGSGNAAPAEGSKPAEDSTNTTETSTQQTSAAPADNVSVKKGEWTNIEWETYTDTSGLFTIDIPKGWNVEVHDGQAAGKLMGLGVSVSTPDKKVGAEMLDYISIDNKKMTEQTVESLFNALYSSYERNIIDTSVPDNLKKIKNQHDTAIDTKVIHGELKKSDEDSEIMFSAFVVKSLMSNVNSAILIRSGYAPFGEYSNWSEVFKKIQGSLQYTDTYNNRYQSSGSTGSVNNSGSSTVNNDLSDAMMNSWNARNKSEDIMNQKRQDTTLGYERVYDTQTGEIYRADSGFMEQYDKLDGQRYASATDEMYTEGYSGYISMD